MSLTLYFHPLSSYCWKVLAALYENETAFTPHLVDLGDPAARAAFVALWPIGKFPVLRDDARGATVPESSIIIEYLGQHYPGRTPLIPDDREQARGVRAQDRFFDLHVHDPMQRIVGDRLRPAGQKDPLGVERARAALATALDMVEREMAARTWAAGEAFSMADCAAAPALYYANLVLPFAATHPRTTAYSARLLARPCVARAVSEAEPYRAMFPG
jgi:glutathione S-transferase